MPMFYENYACPCEFSQLAFRFRCRANICPKLAMIVNVERFPVIMYTEVVDQNNDCGHIDMSKWLRAIIALALWTSYML